jgi:isoleucyl-tRNA synthetase
MFKPVSSKLNLIPLEHRILRFWANHGTFEKLREQNKNGPSWSFLDGPITANNPMGVHHAWGRTYKDISQRYRAMRGYHLRYQNGFDCQGLWVEVEVERELGFTSKRDIEAYGVEEFAQRCKQRVFKFSRIQTEQSIRLGYWMDWTNSYYTMSDENNYTIWLFLKRCHEHGWIYQGHDVMPWCPRCSCALSEHEIATEGYKELTHKAVYFFFPLIDKPRESLLVWTTTPWTLSSNVAAAVHPELDYIKVEKDDKILYLSEGAQSVLDGEFKVIERLKGSDMVGFTYRGPFDELAAQQDVQHSVISWDEVSETEGTGIVHIAPGCGKEDFALSAEWDLPAIAPLDEYGVFVKGFEPLTGTTAQDASSSVFQWLEERQILYKIEDYTHRYPVCWRCGAELVFRLVDEWFISMDELRPKIMEVAKRIKWMPSFGLDRELDWLRNMHDWCISKKRFWGLALPIFVCKEGHFHVVGSEDELRERAVEGWDDFEGHSPHRPWVDNVTISCPTCGEQASRIPDVGNPWLDAGIVPYSTLGYRHNVDQWQTWFPPEFITECFPGQFRNWFYCLLAMSTVLEEKEPFKVVLGHASVRDEKGEEMHKSAGNAIWFDDAAEKMGVEAMRWIFCRQNPYVNLNFGYGQGKEVLKRLSTLWNSYVFFVTYAQVDGITPDSIPEQVSAPPLLDRWITARLAQLAKHAREAMENYELSGFARAAEQFLDDLSNWYIRRSRRRFWKSQSDEDKHSAYATLYHSILTFCKLVAPILPFLTEEIYQTLAPEGSSHSRGSVHLESYPDLEPTAEDDELVELMSMAQGMVTLGHAARNKAGIKVRQPLEEAVFKGWPKRKQDAWELVEPIVRDELNLKRIRLAGSDEELAELSVKPDFARLGPKIGSKVKQLAEKLKHESHAAAAELSRGTPWRTLLGEEEMEIVPDDVVIERTSPEGWLHLIENDLEISLKTIVSDELAREGAARDIVRRLQNLRKESGLDVSDRIQVYISDSQGIETLIEEQGEYIRQEVLATKLTVGKPPKTASTTTSPFGETNVVVGLRKVARKKG